MKRPNIKAYQNPDGKVMLGFMDHVIKEQEKYIDHLDEKVKKLQEQLDQANDHIKLLMTQ